MSISILASFVLGLQCKIASNFYYISTVASFDIYIPLKVQHPYASI